MLLYDVIALDIINIVAVTVFGVVHAVDDGFSTSDMLFRLSMFHKLTGFHWE